ncbi:BMA-NOLA-3 [Dirofilaria immitis]|nr:BMA-NOLA-3 [Dirofilaria immitis]
MNTVDLMIPLRYKGYVVVNNVKYSKVLVKQLRDDIEVLIGFCNFPIILIDYAVLTTDPQGRQTQSAHPARFSPEDKNSKYRIIIKKRFDFIMLIWEWRRKWRQYIRNRRPPSRLSYQELTKGIQKFHSFFLFWDGMPLAL